MITPAARLFVVGVNHHTAPLEWREKLALREDQRSEFQTRLSALPGLQELVILNTCNRVEFYGVVDQASTIDRLRAIFCDTQQVDQADFAAREFCQTGEAVINHLSCVSAGIESQFVGENEIFGQVKDAYAEAQTVNSVGPVLHKVFQKSFQVAKHVRTATAIAAGQVSTANIAVELSLNIFGSLADARLLFIGAGKIGQQTAQAFRSRGATNLTVASRVMTKAMEWATELDARALPFEQLEHHLAEFDIIAGATAAPEAILDRAILAQAMARRPAAPLFLIDLALPRDIDPQAALLDNVYLYNLDDLARISAQNQVARTAEIAKAREIIALKTTHLWKSLGRRR